MEIKEREKEKAIVVPDDIVDKEIYSSQTKLAQSKGRFTITTTISPEFHELAKQYGISWAEAIRVGVSILLADQDVIPYQNDLNLYRKMRYFQHQAQEMSQKFHEIQEAYQKKVGIKKEKKDGK